MMRYEGGGLALALAVVVALALLVGLWLFRPELRRWWGMERWRRCKPEAWEKPVIRRAARSTR
ncbi:hypothetical protein PO878_04095 [Iamia majanohamensis]|uniref:Uncharacterized protein n=1 Tax=Iamia majanohamensis TaxID=467976 RepID=A0AAE9YBD1_9ACTN|nr:hypothetical protein [Iamia majanohamensis]WCO67904.1 hypothetical protein PO878_04095 [Iamia majanohamensis]